MSDTTIKALEAATGGTDLGAISVMQSTTPVKITKTTVVDQTGAEVPFALNATVAAVTTSLGTDGTSPPSIAGTGVRGWLRAIYDRLVAGIGRTWSLSSGTDSVTTVPSGTQAINGTVSVANFPATQTVSGTVTVQDGGGSVTVDGSVSVANFPATQTVSGTITANQGTAGAQAWPVSDGGASLTIDGTVGVNNFPATQAVNITQVNGATNTPTNVLYTVEPPVIALTTTGAAAAAATLTIPAPAAGQFIYLMGYELLLVNTAARATATATLITVTTTNLGTLSWSYGSPVTAVGSTDRTVAMSLPAPIKAAAAATACTIAAPATTGVQWMIKAFYYVGP